jgi:hypothetical protein
MAEDISLTLAEWLGRWLGRKDRPTLVLAHCSEGASTVLDTLELCDAGEEQPTASGLALRFVSEAQAHADTSTRAQRYALAAQTKAGRVLGQTFWRLSSSSALAGVGDHDTEPATPAGVLSQSMRHNEACMRMLVESIGATMTRMAGQLDTQGKQLAMFAAQQVAQLEATQRIFDFEHTRQLELDDAKAKMARAERGSKMLEQGILPLLTGKLTGATDLVSFMHDLTQEQFESIAGTLTADQFKRLGKLISLGARAEAGEEVLLQEAAKPGTPAGEAIAAARTEGTGESS